MAGSNYAFRKTIRPIRPKPLMPTSVSDMFKFSLYQSTRVWNGKRLSGWGEFGLGDGEVGILETGVFGGARRGVIYFLFFFLLLFFLGKCRAIAGGLVSISSVPPERFVIYFRANYSSLI